VFNSGILVVGSLIVSYVAVVGVINTANDGEGRWGRNWSSLWTPVRIVAGGASLLPTASGFSFIQLFAMMLALWGAGLANTIYTKGVEFGILDPSGIVGATNAPGSYTACASSPGSTPPRATAPVRQISCMPTRTPATARRCKPTPRRTRSSIRAAVMNRCSS
jgi:hypothetical protein